MFSRPPRGGRVGNRATPSGFGSRGAPWAPRAWFGRSAARSSGAAVGALRSGRGERLCSCLKASVGERSSLPSTGFSRLFGDWEASLPQVCGDGRAGELRAQPPGAVVLRCCPARLGAKRKRGERRAEADRRARSCGKKLLLEPREMLRERCRSAGTLSGSAATHGDWRSGETGWH